jgi:hypothetical protein
MPENTQNYSNHVRRHIPYLFFLVPVITLNLAWMIKKFADAPSLDTGVSLLLAAGLVVMISLVRTYALKVQDRVIRLEEQLRYQRLLPADLAARASALPTRFIIAMRFASDRELPDIAQQTVDGAFAKPDELKQAIKYWRADHLRV